MKATIKPNVLIQVSPFPHDFVVSRSIDHLPFQAQKNGMPCMVLPLRLPEEPILRKQTEESLA
jgi:hypothetical protein